MMLSFELCLYMLCVYFFETGRVRRGQNHRSPPPKRELSGINEDYIFGGCTCALVIRS